ncbi:MULTISPECIES: DoxX family protein [Microterricola]|uniref:DoxX-like family protein n=2 Tax=Microterricola TaxID=518733 RepID=A0A1H1LJN9_9MICO|nr:MULTISPECIES: DoxX family protein [Microterricola]PPL19669.1 hypothetical protein GY24_04970 [Microterricola pindariensis]SDR74647.1 DoxX-like family protein [Microterricola viridarii]
MTIALWIATGVLAALYLLAGFMKATTPYETIGTKMPWVNSFKPSQVKTIGVLEVLGGLGLVLPQATGILPWLTVVAAFALVLVQIVAAVVHVRRREFSSLPINGVLAVFALAVGVLWLV